MSPTSSSSDLSFSSVCYCALCKKEVVQVETDLDLKANQKTPNPGSSGSLPKLISREECVIVLFQHILNIPPPPNIYNTQIKSKCKNDDESDSLSSESEWSSQIDFCQSCLTRLSHIHAIVGQLARIKEKAQIAVKLSKEEEVAGVGRRRGDPTNSVSSAAAAVQLPGDERRQSFSELRSAVYGGLKLLNPSKLLAIVENLSAKRRSKRPTVPPAVAQPTPHFFPFPTRFGSGSASKVLIMKDVSIRRCQLPTPRSSATLPCSLSTEKTQEEERENQAEAKGIVSENSEPAPNSVVGMRMSVVTRRTNSASAAPAMQPKIPVTTLQATRAAGVAGHSSIPKEHKCTLCPAKFRRKAHVERHMLLHTGQRPFQCPSCPKSFSRNEYLAKHYRTLLGAPCAKAAGIPFPSMGKKYACKLCPAKFVEPSKLRRHEFVHTTDKPFQCPSCPTTFKQERYLKQHLQRGVCSCSRTEQTIIKKYKCPQCPAAVFSLKGSLSRHVQLLHAGAGDKPFQCRRCPRKFRDVWHLKRHRRVHSWKKSFN